MIIKFGIPFRFRRINQVQRARRWQPCWVTDSRSNFNPAYTKYLFSAIVDVRRSKKVRMIYGDRKELAGFAVCPSIRWWTEERRWASAFRRSKQFFFLALTLTAWAPPPLAEDSAHSGDSGLTASIRDKFHLACTCEAHGCGHVLVNQGGDLGPLNFILLL